MTYDTFVWMMVDKDGYLMHGKTDGCLGCVSQELAEEARRRYLRLGYDTRWKKMTFFRASRLLPGGCNHITIMQSFKDDGSAEQETYPIDREPTAPDGQNRV